MYIYLKKSFMIGIGSCNCGDREVLWFAVCYPEVQKSWWCNSSLRLRGVYGIKPCSRGAWVAQSVKRLDFSSGHDLAVRGFQPRVGLCADSSEPPWDSLALCLSLPLPRLLSLSLSQNQETLKNNSLKPGSRAKADVQAPAKGG